MVSETVLTDGIVTLRPYRTGDVEALHAAVLESVAELEPYLDFASDSYSLEQSTAWVSGRPELWAQGTHYDFAITDTESGEYLGGCGLNDLDDMRRVANLGYWVKTSKTGKGVATRATRLLLRFGVDQLGLERIGLKIALPNKASQRVAEKAGATREGVLRSGMFVRDFMYDCIVYSVIPQDVRAHT